MFFERQWKFRGERWDRGICRSRQQSNDYDECTIHLLELHENKSTTEERQFLLRIAVPPPAASLTRYFNGRHSYICVCLYTDSVAVICNVSFFPWLRKCEINSFASWHARTAILFMSPRPKEIYYFVPSCCSDTNRVTARRREVGSEVGLTVTHWRYTVLYIWAYSCSIMSRIFINILAYGGH
jgi:hypothetical protein